MADNKGSADEVLSPEERERLEAIYTSRRSMQLRIDPVQGNFDAAHLREVNRRIFQDLPDLGFRNVTPGEYRRPTPPGADWMKYRVLESQNTTLAVAYSMMDRNAIYRLECALEAANPIELGKLKTDDFIRTMGKLYAELDYVHPFSDGNSRTLRTFTKQLAEASGYNLDWERFGANKFGRDLLYIARDKSVNELALPNMRNQESKRDVALSIDAMARSRDMPNLLRDAIRPSRAIAFERLSEEEALHAHADLGEAYETMHKAARYFEMKAPGDTVAQQSALLTVRQRIQSQLDQGETRDFRQMAAGKKKVTAGPDKKRSDIERER